MRDPFPGEFPPQYERDGKLTFTCCEDWEHNIPKVGPRDGILFKYCPWCGKKKWKPQ